MDPLLLDLTDEDLGDGIAQTEAARSVLLGSQLEFIAAFDAKRAWKQDGASSMADWLVLRLGLRRDDAFERVRVAHALEQLPAIAAAHSDGRFSFDQLRSLTRFATPERDAELAEEAPGWSVSHLERLARQAREVSVDEEKLEHERRRLRMRWDPDRGSLLLNGRLPAAQGAVVHKALAGIAEQAPSDEGTGMQESFEARCADALVELCGGRLASDQNVDRATVVVHVQDSTLLEGRGSACIEDGPAISPETALRLSCDARVEVLSHGAGVPIGIGRASRNVPAPMYRELRRRDGGCRFPGCGRFARVNAHHITHWARGGRTDPDNLALLCAFHHHLVHEGGWTMSGDPFGPLTFRRPDGRRFRSGRPPLRESARSRIAFLPWVSRPGPPTDRGP